jgi:hypothetical protein
LVRTSTVFVPGRLVVVNVFVAGSGASAKDPSVALAASSFQLEENTSATAQTTPAATPFVPFGFIARSIVQKCGGAKGENASTC